MNTIVHVSDNNFDQVVINSNIPVLVDFWATWCGPCKMIAPILEELAPIYADRLAIAKIDSDANPKTSNKFGIRSIPALLIFKNGKVIEHIIGYQSKNVLQAKLDAILAG